MKIKEEMKVYKEDGLWCFILPDVIISPIVFDKTISKKLDKLFEKLIKIFESK